MSTNLVQNDMKQSTSPTSTAISTDSLTSTDTNSSICSCVSTISIMQDKYNEVDSNNNALSIENERLWAIVNKLEQENQKLTRAVNHFLKKSANVLVNEYLKY